MAGIQVEFPASIDPLSLTQTKQFLRVDNITDDDALITAMISGATRACESYTRRSFINKGFIQTLDSFPYFTDTMLSQMAYPPSYYALPRYATTLWNYSQMIKLFRPPLVSVDRITYCSSGDFQFHDLVPQPSPWYPQTTYPNGAQVLDNNGNIQTLVAANPSINSGKSGINPPGSKGTNSNFQPQPTVFWNTQIGGVTVEAAPATAVWVNTAPAPQGEFGAYIVDTFSEPARIFPGIQTPSSGPTAGYWPSVAYIPNAVQIHFTAGYGPNASNVPPGIIAAIQMLVAYLYENREPMDKGEPVLPPAVKMMLAEYCAWDFQPTRG